MKNYALDTRTNHTNMDARVRAYLTTRFTDHTDTIVDTWMLGSHNGRLAIPYLTATSHVLDVRTRCAIDHDCKEAKHPKYLSDKRNQPHLYNARATLTTANPSVVCIVEGEIDTITLDHIGGIPAVGVPGAHVWKSDKGNAWRHLFADIDHVFIITDGDKAGTEFAIAVGAAIQHADTITMPAGEDVNSYWLKHGTTALLNHIDLPNRIAS